MMRLTLTNEQSHLHRGSNNTSLKINYLRGSLLWKSFTGH